MYILTKEECLDTIIARIAAKWPGIDTAPERESLAKRSHGKLLMDVATGLYAPDAPITPDPEMVRAAKELMTKEDLRAYRNAG